MGRKVAAVLFRRGSGLDQLKRVVLKDVPRKPGHIGLAVVAEGRDGFTSATCMAYLEDGSEELMALGDASKGNVEDLLARLCKGGTVPVSVVLTRDYRTKKWWEETRCGDEAEFRGDDPAELVRFIRELRPGPFAWIQPPEHADSVQRRRAAALNDLLDELTGQVKAAGSTYDMLTLVAHREDSKLRRADVLVAAEPDVLSVQAVELTDQLERLAEIMCRAGECWRVLVLRLAGTTPELDIYDGADADPYVLDGDDPLVLAEKVAAPG